MLFYLWLSGFEAISWSSGWGGKCSSGVTRENEGGEQKATLQLVDMECGYLTVEFFRKLPQDVDKGGNPTHSIFDRYNDSYLRRIGKSYHYWTP